MSKTADIDAMVIDAIATSPDVNPEKAQRAQAAYTESEASEVAQATVEPLFGDEVAQRHGRVAASAIGVGMRHFANEELDSDVSATMGDAFGELFGLLNRMQAKWVYWGLLGASLIPIGAIIGKKAYEGFKEVKGTK